MSGVIEYKVDSRWSKKWKQQVYVVERHNSSVHNPRFIAVYTDVDKARFICAALNDRTDWER